MHSTRFSTRTLSLQTTVGMAALVLAGCAGPDFHRPTPPPVGGYTRESLPVSPSVNGQQFKTGASVPPEWWRDFDSPTLAALIDTALAHNPTIESAEAILRQAHAATAAQRAAYFPTLGASFSPSRQRNAVGTISPTLTSGEPVFNLYTGQVNVSYSPDVFGLNRRTVENLIALEQAQAWQLRAARLTIASNVATAAIQIAALRAEVAATERNIAIGEHLVEVLRHQRELGAASGIDVATQEAALAQARQALPPLRKQLEQTRDQLAILVGRYPSEGGRENLDLDDLRFPRDLPVSLPTNLVRQRPDILAAEAQVHAASAQVGVAVANRLPQFSITGNAGGSATRFSQMFAAGNVFWAIIGNVSQTIFDAGVLHERQLAAQATLDAAMAQYRATVLGAFQNVADTLYALRFDGDALDAADASMQAARRTFELVRRQAENGYVNQLAVLNAETTLHQAEISHIQAKAARCADTVALFQALGGGWQDEKSQPGSK